MGRALHSALYVDSLNLPDDSGGQLFAQDSLSCGFSPEGLKSQETA